MNHIVMRIAQRMEIGKLYKSEYEVYGTPGICIVVRTPQGIFWSDKDRRYTNNILCLYEEVQEEVMKGIRFTRGEEVC